MTKGIRHGPGHGLAAGMNVNVLDRHLLLAAAPEFLQCLGLCHADALEVGGNTGAGLHVGIEVQGCAGDFPDSRSGRLGHAVVLITDA